MPKKKYMQVINFMINIFYDQSKDLMIIIIIKLKKKKSKLKFKTRPDPIPEFIIN